MKKAVIEIGFAWIFILIAGAVILGLFTYVGITQSEGIQDLISAKFLTDLSTIFAGAQVSRNTAALFEIPKTKIRFDCDSYGVGGIDHHYGDRYVFAPGEIDSDTLISWSKSWSLGFRVTNFLFITSPYIKYYVVYDPTPPPDQLGSDKVARRIYNDLPSQLNKDMFDIELSTKKIKDENYDKIVVLVFGVSNPQSYGNLAPQVYDKTEFDDYKNDEVTFIYVTGANSLEKEEFVGYIVFKNKENKVVKVNNQDVNEIIDESALFAAFISGNPELFGCIQKKAFRKAKTVAQLYLNRIDRLPDFHCLYYGSVGPPATGARKNLIEMIIELGADEINVDPVLQKVQGLREDNRNLEKSSCPLIY